MLKSSTTLPHNKKAYKGLIKAIKDKRGGTNSIIRLRSSFSVYLV
ncbi:hypothetical protein FOXB_17769 [Fusarium oxysporum f. sp. conglutinans Fo5176]|uniref:Uncharacterized protein n=1 Tax=Fusarium oxysporum (strain Fo5176) TaxID=660025 RepID=F9GGI5_FUSOF|nr:hypothetical protein FOXB_17769 [Fusarium oxysporum f. sp. conglutinans Fo5176]